MKLKLYIFASLLLIIATAIYVFMSFGDTIIVHTIYTIELAMPTYIWVILPMIILFLASLFHMIFYGLKLKFTISRLQKDAHNLKDSIKGLLLEKKKKYTIKNKELNDIAEALAITSLQVEGDLSTLETNELLQSLETNKTIYSGGYVKLSKSSHNKDSQLIAQNNLNRLKVEESFAKQVIKNKENYPKIVIDKAVLFYTETINAKELKSIISIIDKNTIKEIIKRIENNSLLIDEELVEQLFSRCDVTQLLPFTKAVKSQLAPDITLTIFKSFMEKDLNAKVCYIYLLLEFEMLEKAREILIEEAGFENFKAYLDLREAGKKYPLDMFL